MIAYTDHTAPRTVNPPRISALEETAYAKHATHAAGSTRPLFVSLSEKYAYTYARVGGSEFERARSDTTGARSTDGHVLFRSVETRACEPDHGADHQGAMIRLTRIRIIHSHSHFDALDSCLDERTMVSRRRTHLSRPSGPSQDLI